MKPFTCSKDIVMGSFTPALSIQRSFFTTAVWIFKHITRCITRGAIEINKRNSMADAIFRRYDGQNIFFCLSEVCIKTEIWGMEYSKHLWMRLLICRYPLLQFFPVLYPVLSIVLFLCLYVSHYGSLPFIYLNRLTIIIKYPDDRFTHLFQDIFPCNMVIVSL